MFSRKRSPESSSSEPSRKSQNRGSRAGSDASNGHRSYESTSRRTYYPSKDNYRSDRGSTRDQYERRPSSFDARASRETSWFSRSPPKGNDEELEPPGTESSTLQYILTPRMPYSAWKNRLYQELEELNCLFTIEPALKKKGNMPLEDELKYRSLAKAIISMRLDNTHLALVTSIEDPLKAMKVLNDFRDPELRHLETRSQQRLKMFVYDATIPVCDFVRSFENLVKEVEKYSGERISDNMMKKYLLSAVVNDFPNIMASSKALSDEICYDKLKELLIEAVDQPPAAKNIASRNVRVDERCTSSRDEWSLASKMDEVNECRTSNRDERSLVSKTAEVNECHTSIRDEKSLASKTDNVNERYILVTNTANKSGEEKGRHSTSKNIEVSERRPVSITADVSRNAEANASHPASKNVEVSKRYPIGTSTATIKNAVVYERRPTSTNTTSKNVEANERPFADTNATSKNSKVYESHPTGKNGDVDQRPTGTNASTNKNAKVYESRSTGNNVEVDPRPIGTNTAASKNAEGDERRHATISAEAKDWRTAGTNAASKNSDVYERRAVGANAAGKNVDLFERRAATKNAPNANASGNEDEIDDQIESDKRIQDLVEANPRLASKEISCTRCGAYGHVIGDCKRKDSRRKCYSCLKFVSDHVASTCPDRGDYLAVSKILNSQTSSKFTQESLESKFVPQMKPPPVPFVDPRYLQEKLGLPEPPEILDDDEEEEDDYLSDDLPLVDGLRQVYHIRRRFTTKKLKTGRIARKDLIFTDSDFYTDVDYREMFVEANETDPGDIILETIKVMTTKQN